MSAVRRHPIITFFVLTFVISWGFLPFEAIRFLPSGPLIAALIVIPLTQGWAGLRDLGSRIIRWARVGGIILSSQWRRAGRGGYVVGDG